MLNRIIESGRSWRFLVACAALCMGAVAALTRERSVELAPMLAVVLAVAYGVCKTNTP